jgi:hypothetical protein
MSAQSAIFNPSQTTSAASGDGFSVPRLTTTGRLAISFTTQDRGMMVYDTTLNNLFIWTGSAWESVPASGDAGPNGAIQYNDGGVVVGDANLTWDKTTQKQTISGTLEIWDGPGSGADNVGVGRIALTSLSTGASNVAIGAASGYNLTTASNNAFVGNSSGLGVTTGSFNVGVGINTMATSGPVFHTGNNNIAIGNSALFSGQIISGADNVGIGRDSFRTLSSGASNVGIGLNSLNLITTGSNNVCVGPGSGFRITTAVNSIALGGNTMSGLSAAVTGTGNIGIGDAALYTDGASGLSGGGNVAIGLSAGRNTNTGNSNVYIGNLSGYSANAITGSDNIGIGRETLRGLSSG